MIATNSKNVLNIPIGLDYVILLEDLEFAMPKEQLREITQLHNNGMKLEDIAQEVKRNEYEVLIALIHQAKRGVKLKPFAYRRGKGWAKK